MNNNRDRLTELIRESKSIDNEIIGFIESNEPRYIYGNGLQSAVCLQIFRDLDVKIEGILLPPGAKKAKYNGYWGKLLNSINAFDLTEVKPCSTILLGIDKAAYEYVRLLLEYSGFSNIYICSWKHNSDMQELCWKIYNGFKKR